MHACPSNLAYRARLRSIEESLRVLRTWGFWVARLSLDCGTEGDGAWSVVSVDVVAVTVAVVVGSLLQDCLLLPWVVDVDEWCIVDDLERASLGLGQPSPTCGTCLRGRFSVPGALLDVGMSNFEGRTGAALDEVSEKKEIQRVK